MDKALQREQTRKRVERYRDRVRLGLTSSWGRNRKPYVTPKGYRYVWLDPESPFTSMADAYGYVAEHRLVVAKRLNRPLKRYEVVHHKGTKYPIRSAENKGDNRDENLELVSGGQHHQLTLLENRISYLEGRIILLEAENILLRGSNNAVERV